MMDASEVRRIAEAALEPMATALHVREYEVYLEFDRVDGDSCATCTVNPPYLKAHVVIDPAQMRDEAHALHTLRHELLHLVHAEFEPYRLVAQGYIDGPTARPGDGDAEWVLYTLAAERTVAKLERMLDQLGCTPERLARWPDA